MDILQAIDLRKSRRSYLPTKIDVEKLQEIYDLIQIYNKRGNLSIKIMEDAAEAFDGLRKSYGIFKGVKTIIMFIGNNDDNKLEEKIGYYGERIVLKATELGLGTCWVGGTFDRNSDVFKIKEDQKLVCVVTVGNVDDSISFKEKLVDKILHRSRKSIEDFYKSDEDVPNWFINGIKSVMKAPSALNKQPVYFKYKKGKIDVEVRGSEYYNLIDKGIAECHFEIGSGGKFDIDNNSVFIKE